MKPFSTEEHQTANAVADLMARTIGLTALDRDAMQVTKQTLIGPRHLQMTLTCNPTDVPLLLGGKGSNAKTVRELSTGALPPASFVDLHFDVPELVGERGPRCFTALPELPPELVAEFTDVVIEWHRILGGIDPAVEFQTTSRCDVWLVQGRGIPGASMGGLRRVIGWACKVRGRNGFIEWEGQR